MNNELAHALRAPVEAFVVAPDRMVSGQPLGEPQKDTGFHADVTRAFEAHARRRTVYAALERHVDAWEHVLGAVRAQGLPDVLAAVPYELTVYGEAADATSCRAGPWDLTPEEAHRASTVHGAPTLLRDCRLDGSPASWSPSELATPWLHQAAWWDTEAGSCRLGPCAIDRRGDLDVSTLAGLALLREAWDHPDLRATGSAVQLTLAARVAGTDDSRWGRQRSLNLVPAVRHDQSKGFPGTTIVGRNRLCADPTSTTRCGSVFHARAQHAPAATVGVHLVAVCYYAQEHGDRPVFAAWRPWLGDYCRTIVVPHRNEVLAWSVGHP
ncbi:MAG: hypothetical protein H6736_24625 [Alphaproteobacteria bacterium]|nr:hypothetical protein [Alphaproteobacteria bacterium]MCB9690717.1 hypothetical protein [Alphaproteobacteria bacterium]MCB9695001.1 hypothetical protein [Alphaproteobacteria bacterium]